MLLSGESFLINANAADILQIHSKASSRYKYNRVLIPGIGSSSSIIRAKDFKLFTVKLL